MPYKDPDIQKEKKKDIRLRRKEFSKALKDMQPCTDCGVPYPWYVMQWDHIKNKTFTISQKKGTYSEKKLLAEIEKCELVCANCHAERTYSRSFGGIA